MVARGQVIQFTGQPADPHVASMRDELQRVIGRVTSLNSIPLISSPTNGGITITPAVSPGTSLLMTHHGMDFSDAGIDLVRLITYAKNSTANSYTIQWFDVTNNKPITTVIVTGVTAQQYYGAWTQLTATGGDQEVECRVIGVNTDSATIYRLEAQSSTQNAKP